MRNLTIELKKCKHTGILEVLPILGLLGALYAFANFTVRKDVVKLTSSTYGCFADTALRNDYGSQYVWHYRSDNFNI